MVNYLLDSTFESLIKKMISKDVRFGHLSASILDTCTVENTQQKTENNAADAKANAAGKGSQDPLPASTKGKKDESSSSKPKASVSHEYLQNALLYDAWLNCYVSLIEDRCINAVEIKQALFARLSKTGLISYIKDSCGFWDNFCYKGIIEDDPFFKPLLEEILSQEYPDLTSIQVAAQIFRYGKRLSPFGNSQLAAACEQEFWNCEKMNRENDKSETSWYWVRRVRQTLEKQSKDLLKYGGKVVSEKGLLKYADKILDDNGTLLEMINEIGELADNSNQFISPNSIQETCRCRLCKNIVLDIFLDISNPFISLSMQENFKDEYTKSRREYWKSIKAYGSGRAFEFSDLIVDISYTVGHIVPKNWKSYRMVGSDQVLNYHKQSVIERHLRSVAGETLTVFWPYTDKRKKPKLINISIGDQMPIEDQSLQRDRAFEGAIGKGTDTLDLSSASDLHRKSVVRAIYPNDWARLLCQWVPKGMIIGKKKCNLKMFAPMGSPLTFRTMQVTLYAIIVTVTEVVGALLRWSPERLEEALRKAGVFGDDITCDSEITETLIEVLHLFGFKVNMEKSCTSYGQHLFREACGGDYYDGIDISTAYWPRKQIDFTKFGSKTDYSVDGFSMEKDDPVTTLIAHSKAIRKFSIKASQYLNSVILKKIPTMTTSDVGSTSPDLWARFPVAKPTVASPHVRDIFVHKVFPQYKMAILGDKDWKDKGVIIEAKDSPARALQVKRELKMVNGKLENTLSYVAEPVDLILPPVGEMRIHPRYPIGIRQDVYDSRKEYVLRCDVSNVYNHEWISDGSHDNESRRELTCTPIPIFNRKKLTDKCIVERALIKRYNLDIDALINYYSYVQQTSSVSRYEDGLMELLRIPEKFDENSLFSNPTLKFVRK